jgi:uncharacterized membrane protein SpoIIM required for sporulation
MIIDLQKFITTERSFWQELEKMMALQEEDPYRHMSFEQIKRLHYLYQRASADLAKINTFSAERAMRLYLESLVGRAYAVIHGAHHKAVRLSPLQWFWRAFPQTFRKQWKAFAVSLAVMLIGSLFGGAAVVIDPEAKAVLMPFEHLQMDPAERVAKEEKAAGQEGIKGAKGSFSAFLMTHNTRVSILVLALGMTWGVGTLVVLFSNGVMLGAVVADYVLAGQSAFLVGWLLPHGAVEIPSILLAGQGGLLLAGALLGRPAAFSIGRRLQAVVPDVVNLMGGVAVLLIWAGLVEAFFSQYHEPLLPYTVKIAFGLVELALLILFLGWAGQREVGSRARRRNVIRRDPRSLEIG